jgi:predicted Rossmann fold nucleotide-binding protein DprA/Smf involved in DNA uptake
MKPTLITLPVDIRKRFDAEKPLQLSCIGNADLLNTPLLGLIASRECPGHIMIETLDRIPEWIKERKTIVSGFHSPLEQQVFHSLLRRKGCVIKVLARGVRDYRPLAHEQEPLAEGRMLIVTARPSTVTRTTRATALERNRLVLVLTEEHCVPYLSPNSPLQAMVSSVSPEKSSMRSIAGKDGA